METFRRIESVASGTPTLEGAGVKMNNPAASSGVSQRTESVDAAIGD